MVRNLKIKPPFFEIGPKNYLVGSDVVELSRIADEAAARHGIQVIFTTPYTNISQVAEKTRNLFVFAPHMDCTPVGRGLANVLPEALCAAGATGVMLNHAERPLSVVELLETMRRARALQMMTIVCATSVLETRAVAELHPDMIVSEPLELIGTGNSVGEQFVQKAMNTVLSVDPDIGVLVGGGVSNGNDVYSIIRAGADATGSSSAIALAKDPEEKINEMLAAARQAWDERMAESGQMWGEHLMQITSVG